MCPFNSKYYYFINTIIGIDGIFSEVSLIIYRRAFLQKPVRPRNMDSVIF